MTEQRATKAVDEHIGRRVRERRLEIGMSQEHLAELLGVTFQQIQKYEKGVNRVAASRLYDMTGALDVDIAYFFDGLKKSKRSPKAG
jgi:transcriptional regulator with XRE-family HTH domain